MNPVLRLQLSELPYVKETHALVHQLLFSRMGVSSLHRNPRVAVSGVWEKNNIQPRESLPESPGLNWWSLEITSNVWKDVSLPSEA